jgi:hypothetical protein
MSPLASLSSQLPLPNPALLARSYEGAAIPAIAGETLRDANTWTTHSPSSPANEPVSTPPAACGSYSDNIPLPATGDSHASVSSAQTAFAISTSAAMDWSAGSSPPWELPDDVGPSSSAPATPQRTNTSQTSNAKVQSSTDKTEPKSNQSPVSKLLEDTLGTLLRTMCCTELGRIYALASGSYWLPQERIKNQSLKGALCIRRHTIHTFRSCSLSCLQATQASQMASHPTDRRWKTRYVATAMVRAS